MGAATGAGVPSLEIPGATKPGDDGGAITAGARAGCGTAGDAADFEAEGAEIHGSRTPLGGGDADFAVATGGETAFEAFGAVAGGATFVAGGGIVAAGDGAAAVGGAGAVVVAGAGAAGSGADAGGISGPTAASGAAGAAAGLAGVPAAADAGSAAFSTGSSATWPGPPRV